MQNKLWQCLALAVLVTAAAGCQSTFHRDWEAARKAGAPAGSLAGAWDGTWLSHTNGHRGRLRALISPGADGVLQTRFHATYWKLFSAEYSVKLQATPLAGEYRLQGREDLGRVFGFQLGEFTYQGTATTNEFRCVYGSKLDGGVFQMHRP